MLSARRVRWLLIVGVAMLVLTVGTARSQSSTTNPYRATFGWEKLPDGRAMGTVSGVFPDPDGRHLWTWVLEWREPVRRHRPGSDFEV